MFESQIPNETNENILESSNSKNFYLSHSY